MPFTKGHIGYTPKLSKKHKENLSKSLKGKKGLSGSANPQWKGKKPPCSVCRKELTKHYSWLPKEKLDNKKCSTCYKKWQSKKENNPNWKGEKPKCKDCKKQLSVGKTKNKLCNKCFGKSKRGKNSPNWKGGITPINEAIRKSIEYKEWRKAVFKRDNYTCIWCKKKDKTIEADHIKPFATFIELRFDINNGRTLCKECHKKTDTYGVKISKPKENRVNSGEVQNG